MTPEKRIEIFEKTPVKKAVILQIIPAIASQMIALIYNLADTYFVSMLSDANQTAAVTIVSSPFILLTAVSNLFGVGGASNISRNLGKKDPERAKRIASIVFYLGLISGLMVSMIFFAAMTPILKLCGADAGVMPYATGYATYTIVVGGTITIVANLLSNCLRAEGCAMWAAIGTSAGGIINIILDPFFVLPSFLNMGAVGAGMATAISNFIVLMYFIVFILARTKRNGIANFDIRNLRYIKKELPPVLKSGFPSALQYALTVVAVAAQMRFTSKYGANAVAALGIVKKLDQLPLYFSVGVSTGLLPLLAYTHVVNRDRRREAFKFGCIISFSFSTLCLIIYEIFAPELTGLFQMDELTIGYATRFLRHMVVAMPMMSVCYPMIIQFQATGKTKESIICSLLRKGVIDIPILFLMDAVYPLYGITWVQPIVDTVSLIVAVIFYIIIVKKERKESSVPDNKTPTE